MSERSQLIDGFAENSSVRRARSPMSPSLSFRARTSTTRLRCEAVPWRGDPIPTRLRRRSFTTSARHRTANMAPASCILARSWLRSRPDCG